MPRKVSAKRTSTRSSARSEVTEDFDAKTDGTEVKSKRLATVYDAVAGKIGLNGFLTQAQLASASILPSSPEEVLLRRVSAPDEIPFDFYNAETNLAVDQKLPDSDLLKAIHTYASDYYTASTRERGLRDFRSFDGSALLAMGILLEEASKEAIGEKGDMALTEPEGLEHGLPESNLTKHQVIGKVKLRHSMSQEQHSDEIDELEREQSPRKRRRAET